MKKNKLVGTLCMDLCVSKSFAFPDCATDELAINNQQKTYKFYLINEIDSSFVSPIKSIELNEHNHLKQDLSMDELELKLASFIHVFEKKSILNLFVSIFFYF